MENKKNVVITYILKIIVFDFLANKNRYFNNKPT